MFNSKKASSESNVSVIGNSSVNIIGAGTLLTGELDIAGDIRVDGKVNGNISAKGKVVLGASGSAEGNIVCKNADISGEIRGTIMVQDMLVLKTQARVMGDIVTAKLIIESGASFTGKCDMGGSVSDAKFITERREENLPQEELA